MGLFDFTKSQGAGFAKIPNTQGFTNETLLEKLSGVQVSFRGSTSLSGRTAPR